MTLHPIDTQDSESGICRRLAIPQYLQWHTARRYHQPILANIYLDKLDKYIKEYTAKFDKGKKRKISRESMDFGNARKRIVRRLKSVKRRKAKDKS